MKKKYLLSTICWAMSLVIGISIWSCQDDNVQLQQQTLYKTISVNETKSYLSALSQKLLSTKAKGSGIGLTFDPEDFDYEKIINSNELLTVIPASTNIKNAFTRMVLIKKNDTVSHFLYHMIPDSISSFESFNGKVFISDEIGNLLTGFRVKDNQLISRFIIDNYSNKQGNYKNKMASEPEDYDGGLLPEIELHPDTGETTGFPVDYFFDYSDDEQTSDEDLGGGDSGGGEEWDSNDGGSSASYDPIKECSGIEVVGPYGDCRCPNGFVRDKNGKCIERPCLGDPVKNLEVQPQTHSGVAGALHNTCARKVPDEVCHGKVGRKIHIGVDFKNAYGQPVFAMFDGTATPGHQPRGAGHYVVITGEVNGETMRTLYFHLQQDGIKLGNIKAGDIIGYQGVSGNLASALKKNLTDSHVHIKMQKNGANVDPLDYINTEINETTGKPSTQNTNPCT